MKLPKKPTTRKTLVFHAFNSHAYVDEDRVESIFCYFSNINSLLKVFFSRSLR